jgi:hypothetical protein
VRIIPFFAALDLDLWLADRIAELDLYVLPLVLGAVLVAGLIARRRADADEPLADRAGTVRRIGAIHLGLAAWWALGVLPEVVSYLQLGGFASFGIVTVATSLVLTVVNLAIGVGLRGLRPWARWADIALNALATLIAVLTTSWMVRFGAAVDPAHWPEIALSKVLPPFLLFVMLSRTTARAVSPEGRAALAEPIARLRPSGLAIAATLFLILVWVVVAIDALDWTVRLGASASGIAKP